MAAHSYYIGGTIGSAFIANEVPSGDINGFNKIYTLANMPITGTVIITLNGLVQYPGSSKDYTISGTAITFAKAPKIGMEVLTNYMKS